MAKIININAATVVNLSIVSVAVEINDNGVLVNNDTYTFNANDFSSWTDDATNDIAVLRFAEIHTLTIDNTYSSYTYEGTPCADAVELVDLVTANVSANATSGGGGASYTVYRALLTQSGTNAPVATVLENTLGFTPTWVRSGAGFYYVDNAQILAAGAANKLFYQSGCSVRIPNSGDFHYMDFKWDSDVPQLQLLTSDETNYADDIISGGDGFWNLSVIIIIYP